MATKYKYDKDTDYAALMEQAARRGDNAAAAVYEQQRNAKIRGEGMAGQEQTSDYAQYLPIEDVPDYDDAHRREAEALLSERGTTAQRDRIDQMLDALLGEQFDYDPASDKLYAAYRQQYERQAELAAENALGKAAALTGGQASTAAVAASQQAGGYYRAMLAGKLPELAQLAYERYSSEHKTRLSAIDRMLDAADSRETTLVSPDLTTCDDCAARHGRRRLRPRGQQAAAAGQGRGRRKSRRRQESQGRADRSRKGKGRARQGTGGRAQRCAAPDRAHFAQRRHGARRPLAAERIQRRDDRGDAARQKGIILCKPFWQRALSSGSANKTICNYVNYAEIKKLRKRFSLPELFLLA